MKHAKPNTSKALREKAEAMLAAPLNAIQPEDIKNVNRLAHELAIHQAELELQNEELHDTQDRLQETRDSYIALFEHAPVGYIVLDTAGIIRQANATWGTMLNQPDEDFRGKTIADTLVEADAPVFLSRFRAFFRNPANKQIDVRVKRQGAPPFHALIEAQARFLPDGGDTEGQPLKQLLLIVSDISENKQAEQALRKNEEKMLSIYRAAPTGIGVVINRVLQDVNPRLCAMTGYTRAELLGKDARIFYPSQSEYESVGKQKYDQIREKGSGTVETRWQKKDGTIINVLLASTPIDMDDHSKGFTFTALDITERKTAETLLGQRTLELEQRNAALERFGYALSHQLKTPLVSIGTSLGLLEQDLAQHNVEGMIRTVEHINHATRRMDRLLGDLTRLLNFETLPESPKEISLSELVEDVIDQHSEALQRRKVAITLTNEPLTLYGDRFQLQEIWHHLLNNAIAHMGDQPWPRIEVGIARQNEQVCFFVRDNGSGVEPPMQTKIFSLFDQLDLSSRGSGLGLALVKKIVELYDGRIWVESVGTGQGSCFYFTLPATLQHQGSQQ